MTGVLVATVHAQTTADTGSPGILGFVATFVLALAVIGLMLSLTRHLRRVAASPEPPEPDDGTLDDDGSGEAESDDAAPDDGTPDGIAPDDARPDTGARGAADGPGGPS